MATKKRPVQEMRITPEMQTELNERLNQQPGRFPRALDNLLNGTSKSDIPSSSEEGLPIPTNETKKERDKRLNAVRLANKVEDLNLKIKIKGEITEQVMLDFTNDIFKNQADETKNLAAKDYRENPENWKKSAANRARLVIVEATELDAAQLAEMVKNTSPLERILIAGLEGSKKKTFEKELKKLWIESVQKADSNYKRKFEATFEKNENESINDLVNRLSLDALMGPHMHQDGLDISQAVLNQNYPGFGTSLEEILCFGKSKQISEQLPTLARQVSNVPYLPIGFGEGVKNGHWRFHCKDPNKMVGLLTEGISSKELINRDGIAINSSFANSFEFSSHTQSTDATTSENSYILKQEDLDYLKKILTDEALYEANISPKAITKTISKATSWLGAKGGVAVGKALKWNLVNRPKATIEGVHFAIASMVLDGGNDLVKEDLDKKIEYKKFYDKVLEQAIKGGANPEQANNTAAQELVKAYCTAKNDKDINRMVNNQQGVKDWRQWGVNCANDVKKHNEKGLRYLKPMPAIFASSIVLGTVGLTLGALALPTFGLSVAIPAAMGFTLGAIGIASSISSFGLMYKSVKNQEEANIEDLSKANNGFKMANSKQYDVQSKLNTLLDNELTKSIKTVKEKYSQGQEKITSKKVVIRKSQLDRLKESRKKYKNFYKNTDKGKRAVLNTSSSSEGSITPYSSFSDDDKKVNKRRHRRPTKKNSSLSSFSDGDSSQSQLHKPSKKPLSDLTMPNSDWNTASPIGSNTEVKTVTQYKINPPPQIEDNIKLGD